MNLLGDYRYVSQEELAALGSLHKPQPLTMEAAAQAGLASWRHYMQEVCHVELSSPASCVRRIVLVAHNLL